MNQSGEETIRQREPPEAESQFTGDSALTGTLNFVVPVIREELEVRKEVVRTGTVRLSKIVHEAPEMISEHLVTEGIEIERIAMDVIVAAPPPVRMDGDVTVISIVEEVLVVTKQLRLKEEVRVSLRRSVSEYRQEVTLRSEELVVERDEDSTPH